MDKPYIPPSAKFGGEDSAGRISQRTADIMARTKGWVRFIAVVMFVNFAISLVSTILSFGRSPVFENSDTQVSKIAGLIVLFLVYLYPAVKLNSYASRIGELLITGRARDLQAALNEHRGFWRYIGIITLVIISFVLVFILLGVAMGSRW